jgi:O-methyltransferase
MTDLESLDWTRNTLIEEIMRSKMLDLGRISTLMHLIRTAPKTGAVAEFGVYKGYTAALLSTLTTQPLWLYDSFQGLPEVDPGCAPNFKKGKLLASVADVKQTFKLYTKNKPERIIAKWFEELTESDMPENFSFVHLDADMYGGTLAALKLVYPRLVPGAVVVIDDCGWNGLPGVKRAVSAYMDFQKERVWNIETTGDSRQAFFVKEFANSSRTDWPRQN